MRYEWIGARGARLYVETGAGNVIETNAGPDDLEAHAEILRLAARVRELEEEKCEIGRLAGQEIATLRMDLDRYRSVVGPKALAGMASLQNAGHIAALEEENYALINRVIAAEESAESDRGTSALLFERIEQLGEENRRLKEAHRLDGDRIAGLFEENRRLREALAVGRDAIQAARAVAGLADHP